MNEQAANFDPSTIFSMTPEQATAALASMKAAHAPPPDPNTPAGAAAALKAKLDDPKWYGRFANGSAEARSEFNELLERRNVDQVDRIIGQTAEAELPLIETTVGGEISVRKQMAAAASLLEAGITPEKIKQLFTGEPLSRADYETVLQVEREKLSDPEFVKRYLKGGAEERRIMTLVHIYKTLGFKDAA